MPGRRRSSSGRRHTRKRRKNTINILVFKSIDPVLQSLLFVFFLYCIDSETDIPHRDILLYLSGWQLISGIVNFFIKDPEQLRTQRLVCMVTIVAYMTFFTYFVNNVPEHMIALSKTDKPNYPLHEILLSGIALVIAFWYNLICYRELRAMLKGADGDMTV